MNVRWVDPGTRIGAQRGEVVVCIPVYGAHELFVDCLQSVLAHTSATVPILVCDDASLDPRSREFVAGLDGDPTHEHELFYARREDNVGFPANANGGFAAAAPADVVLLNSDCEVGAAWLDGLRDAAYSDTIIATATALADEGSVVSVPEARAAFLRDGRGALSMQQPRCIRTHSALDRI